MRTFVRKWINDVSIVQYADEDGVLFGLVCFRNQEEWNKVKENVDRYFRIKETKIEKEVI